MRNTQKKNTCENQSMRCNARLHSEDKDFQYQYSINQLQENTQTHKTLYADSLIHTFSACRFLTMVSPTPCVARIDCADREADKSTNRESKIEIQTTFFAFFLKATQKTMANTRLEKVSCVCAYVL